MEEMYGIKYSKPEVVLLQETGIGVAETAARTCYDSFCNSENEVVQEIENRLPDTQMCESLNNIEESQLLDDLAWTYFHHSILEHAKVTAIREIVFFKLWLQPFEINSPNLEQLDFVK